MKNLIEAGDLNKNHLLQLFKKAKLFEENILKEIIRRAEKM